MKVVNPLSLCSNEGIQISVEKVSQDDVIIDVEDQSFGASFCLARRQCRELRDWLNAVLDD